jgi:hypothetical protein
MPLEPGNPNAYGTLCLYTLPLYPHTHNNNNNNKKRL